MIITESRYITIEKLSALLLTTFVLLQSCEQPEIVATAIKLSMNELILEKEANDTLAVTFTPANASDKSLTWTSLNPDVATVADGVVVGVEAGSTEILVSNGELTDKCKVTVVISATTVTLNKESVELSIGSIKYLTATVTPSNTTDIVEWSSSAENIATIKDGVVTAVAVGSSIITATAGTQTAKCKVVVKEPFIIEAVDMGLSVKWANANLGAEGPGDYGDYYAWGDVETYYLCQDPFLWKEGKEEGYVWSLYKWGDAQNGLLTKYNTDAAYGTKDNRTVLDPEDDAAHVTLGGGWRMPTAKEMEELRTKCEWTRVTENGVYGYRVTGLNGNSIFLPAAGRLCGTKITYAGVSGYYWSSSLDLVYDRYPSLAVGVSLSSVDVNWCACSRCWGLSVRPVSEQ